MMRLGKTPKTGRRTSSDATADLFFYDRMSLSPAEWSRLILPNLFALDKGVDLKIKPTRSDFKLVMERVAWSSQPYCGAGIDENSCNWTVIIDCGRMCYTGE